MLIHTFLNCIFWIPNDKNLYILSVTTVVGHFFSQFNTRRPMLLKDFFVFDKCFMPLSTRMISVLGSNEGNKEAWSLGYSFILTFAYWQIVWPQSSDVLPEEVLKPEGTILEAEKKIGLENQPMVNEASYNCRFSCCFKSTFRTN